jgi:DNA primase
LEKALQKGISGGFMDILDVLEELGIEVKRKSSTNGGEFAGPCPFCGDGVDRFLVWPYRPNSDGSYVGGRYSCRVCEEFGDAANLMYKMQGVPYRDACRSLNVEPKDRAWSKRKRPALTFFEAVEPSPKWVEKASECVISWHEQLLNNPEALTKVLLRGFTMNSVRYSKFGFNPIDQWLKEEGRENWGLTQEFKEDGKPKPLWIPSGITIPTFGQDGRVIKIKVRRLSYEAEMVEYQRQLEADRIPKRKPQKYVVIEGGQEAPSVYGDTSLATCIAVESEFDALLVQQVAGDLVYCVAAGGSSKPIDKGTYNMLKKTTAIICAPDFDEGGFSFWKRLKKIFPSIHRIHASGNKSIGDAHASGVDVREFLLTEFKKLGVINEH